jgi:hypothetical protein
MKHLTLVIMLALAPLSWGEDVLYCMEEASNGLAFDDNGAPVKKNFTTERFTLKHIVEANRIELAGGPFSNSGRNMRLVCATCSFGESLTLVTAYSAVTHDLTFSLMGDQFVYAMILYGQSVTSGAGTCTKF